MSLVLKSFQSERLLSRTLTFLAACSDASTESRPALLRLFASASSCAAASAAVTDLDTCACALQRGPDCYARQPPQEEHYHG